MSKHPSALGMYSKAHGVFSPSQAQTKHERAPSSLLSLGTLQPSPALAPAGTDVIHSHGRHCLKCPGTKPSLPVAEKYCTISEAGDVLGEKLFPGTATTRQASVNTYSFQRGIESLHSCKLALEPGWYFIFRRVSVTRRIIIMKKTKY